MLQKVKGIVLHSFKHGDSGLIAHIYTENFGRQSFVIYGVRKKKGKAKNYLFHPLSFIEFETDFKENKSIQRIIEVKSALIFNNIYYDIRRSTIAIFLGEILYRNIRESEPNKNLYDFISQSIQLLDITEKGVENFHLIFLLQLTKFLGFFPSTEFIIYNNNILYKEKIDLRYISITDIGYIDISNITRQNMLDEILNFYEKHIMGIGQIKSLMILREVFH
jgi:DNA repair protein RecO (recombination protein O)